MPSETAKVAARVTVDVQPAIAGLESFKKATSEVNAEIKSLIGSTKTAQNVLSQISPLYAQVAATIQNAQGKEITSTEAAELRKLQIIEKGTAAQLGVLELTEARKQAIQGQIAAKTQAIQDESLARQIAALDVAEARKQAITNESELKQLAAIEEAEARRLAILAESGARQDAIAKQTAAKIAETETLAAAKAEAIAMKAAAQQEAIQIQAQARAEYMAGRAQAFHESHAFGGIFRRTSMHLLSAGLLFGGLDIAKEGIVDLDAQMAGMKQVLPELEHSQALADEAARRFVDTAHEYGQAVNLVIESGKLWGRQYKDLDTVMKMVNATTLLSVVDNLDLAEANRALEATLNQYNMTASEAMRVTDSWSNVSHNAQIAARDLAEANERTASVARQVGVDFDHLQGFITAAVRATGQPGANIGKLVAA